MRENRPSGSEVGARSHPSSLPLSCSGGVTLWDLSVGHVGQTGEDVAQVGVGIDAAATAAFKHCMMIALRLPVPGIAGRSQVRFQRFG